MKKVTPTSWKKFMFDQIPKRAQKTGVAYIKYRIAQLHKSLEESRNRKEFDSFGDFIFGRLTEAEEMLVTIQQIEKANK